MLLMRERILKESQREAKPLSHNPFPLSFEGEGDKGGEVDKHSNNWWCP